MQTRHVRVDVVSNVGKQGRLRRVKINQNGRWKILQWSSMLLDKGEPLISYIIEPLISYKRLRYKMQIVGNPAWSLNRRRIAMSSISKALPLEIANSSRNVSKVYIHSVIAMFTCSINMRISACSYIGSAFEEPSLWVTRFVHISLAYLVAFFVQILESLNNHFRRFYSKYDP